MPVTPLPIDMTPGSETTAFLLAVDRYLSANPAAMEPEPDYIATRKGILKELNDLYDIHNSVCQKDERWPKLRRLPIAAIIRFLQWRHIIRVVDLCSYDAALIGEEKASVPHNKELPLCIYDESTGLYLISSKLLEKEALLLEPAMKYQDQKTLLHNLEVGADAVRPTRDPNLVPVANGIFDYRTKELLPFSPDYVFLSKSRIRYVHGAVNPIIHNDADGTDWDIESWMASLSDDPEIVDLLWKVAGACIRPGVSWDKAAFLYSTRGGNGKGTYCEFLRGLCGTTAKLSIADFQKNFSMEELISASAVIADENDVGLYIDRVSDFKAAVTGDVIQIDRKFKAPVSYRFQGFIVQCVNEILRVRDKTGSFARRLLYIPFDKCFVGEKKDALERKYIKHDYLRRTEVLEYALSRILEMDYDELPEPEACARLLHEHRLNNSPVFDFAEQILPECQWNLLPFTFLYDLYKSWFRENSPSGTICSARMFQIELLDILNSRDLGWHCPDKTQQHSSAGNMTGPEPLIMEYGLDTWKNPGYKGADPMKMCCPALKRVYRGITRKPAGPQPNGNGPQGPSDDPNDPGPDTQENLSQATQSLAQDTISGSATQAVQAQPVIGTIYHAQNTAMAANCNTGSPVGPIGTPTKKLEIADSG